MMFFVGITTQMDCMQLKVAIILLSKFVMKNLKLPSKVTVFIWWACIDIIPVNVNLYKQGIQVNTDRRGLKT